MPQLWALTSKCVECKQHTSPRDRKPAQLCQRCRFGNKGKKCYACGKQLYTIAGGSLYCN